MPARGSRRRPRKSADTTPDHIFSVQNHTDVSVDPSPPREPDQPPRILHRNASDAAPDVSVVGNLELPNPTTPPRLGSMYGGFSYAQSQGNQSAPDISQRKKKGRKSQGGIIRPSGTPRPDPNHHPVPAPPQQNLTPSRPNATPVKAYAGPTFHSSPAASSLPIPKFFSRSVPNVDKTSSLNDMMEQETVDTSSESDSPPPLGNNRSTPDYQPREESPLDIFFQADREAKAKAQAQARFGSPAVSSGLRSGSQNDVRHHLRQHTDSSLDGIFTMEMDGAGAETLGGKIDNEPNNPGPKAMTDSEYRDEQRKAQTLELKKLLYSPKPQRSASSSPYSGTLSNGLGSPSPRFTPRGGSPGLAPDSRSKDQQRHAALLALAQKQISGTGTNMVSTPQRPPASKLRKEVLVPNSPEVQTPELPATPTQSHVEKTFTPANNYTRQQQNGYASPYSPFPSAFTPPPKPPEGFQNTPSRRSKDAKSIEEDLRRMLKLDVLGGDDKNGVRS